MSDAAARERPPRKLARKLWIVAAAALGLFFLYTLWPRPQTVTVAVVGRGKVQHEIVDEGRTRIRDVYTVAAPVGGALHRITLEPGDAVVEGQVVAMIQPAAPALLDARIKEETEAAVAAAQSALRAAEAGFAQARVDQERIRELFDKGFASQAALDRTETSLDSARATVNMRRAELARAKAASGQALAPNGGVTTVVSPAAGDVLQVLQESAGIVSPGAPLLQIGEPRNMEIVAEFLSQDAVRMRPGMTARVEAWGGPGAIPATVERVEPFAIRKFSALGVEEQRVNVIAWLDDPESAPPLGHGFRVDLRVVLAGKADALRVPVDALVRDGENWAVFRIVGGRADYAHVDIGEGSGPYREVLSGLSAGDEVILFPGDALKPGDRVAASVNKPD